MYTVKLITLIFSVCHWQVDQKKVDIYDYEQKKLTFTKKSLLV